MHRRQTSLALSGLVLAASLALTGLFARTAVAQQPPPGAEDANDPYENTNRAVFGFNQGLDRTVLVPVSNAYRTVVPPPIRDSVHNILQNLNGPITFANDVLQAEPGLAAETLGRLVLNTTIGFGGFFDVASKLGVPYHTNDMGITLATWGMASGPYLMLPVLGPSNPRDLAGDVADSFGDPANIVLGNAHLLWATFARSAVSGVDERSRNIESLAEIERTSLDYYATIRSLARQRRAAQIRHQREDVPNASPLQGASALPAAAPVPPTVAALPKPQTTMPPITYSVAPRPPASIADMQKSPMGAGR